MAGYSYTGSVQTLTAATAGIYDIVAYGGAGGASGTMGRGHSFEPGGKGAEVAGSFNLEAGERLEIIAGGAGGLGQYSGSSGGGGGASIVVADVNAQGALTPGSYSKLLLVAAGGGGGVVRAANGGSGLSATGANGGAGGAAGGTGGSGGGAGVKGNGGTAYDGTGRYTGGTGGKNLANGSAGGAAGYEGGKGGFGGGGGGAYYGGGGGGGYTGGNGAGSTGGNYQAGGGGTSYDAGTVFAAKTLSGENAGNGKVVIALAPTVINEFAAVLAGSTTTGTGGTTGTGALAGDDDPSGGTLSIASATGASGTAQNIAAGSTAANNPTIVTGTYGTLTIGADGSYSYADTDGLAIVTAADGQPITDTFADAVSSSNGGFASSSLAITTSLASGGTETVNDPTGVATFSIGATTLTLTNDQATSFGGVIQDGSSGNTGGKVVVDATGGVLTLGGANTYTGGTTISAGTLDLASSTAASSGAITFASSPAGTPVTLSLETAAQPVSDGTFGNVITSFGTNDQIDLKGLAYSGSQQVTTLEVSDNSLSVTESGTTETFTLSNPGSTTFDAESDGHGGTLINDSPVVCFTTGTLIRTARGEVAVEDLAVGDLAVTAAGVQRLVTWIGHRDVGVPGRGLPFEQQPVRVLADAFGPDLPVRTLRLSPGHPVLVGADDDDEGGHLVPIMCLVNGTTIEREPRATVTYWHVELDEHDILLAEGLPAESYIDWGDRAFFDQAADHALANPDFVAPGLTSRCRPVAVEGPVVEAERQRLDRVFAMSLKAACCWPSADDLHFGL